MDIVSVYYVVAGAAVASFLLGFCIGVHLTMRALAPRCYNEGEAIVAKLRRTPSYFDLQGHARENSKYKPE